jgi:hypothetical protein
MTIMNIKTKKQINNLTNFFKNTVTSKQNLIKMIDNMKDITVSQMNNNLLINKYKCKIYNINKIIHLVLNEPYNMNIIIDNNQIHINELSNKIESYNNEKYYIHCFLFLYYV